jgi:hypothetical protein
MVRSDPRAVYERFLDVTNRRDVAALDDLLHPDFEEVYPQSGERTRGVENLRKIIENYPGGYYDGGRVRVVGSEDRWVLTPVFSLIRIEGAGDTFTGVRKVHYPDGSDWYVVQIAEIRDDRIWRLQTFFGPLFEAPAWRAEFVEIDAADEAPAPG